MANAENLKKYDEAFMEALEIGEDRLNDDLVYESIETWDSVGHMAALEDAFDIMMDTDDIIDFNSYKKGKTMLSEKYDVEF